MGDKLILYAGSDHPEVVDSVPNPPVFTPDNPSQYATILKTSGNINPISFDGAVIGQGHENSIDINNRCHDITHTNATIGVNGPNGDQVITLKGGSRNIKISGIVHSRGTRQKVDVDIGNWSDQSYDNTQGVTFDLKHVDGKPINVRIGRAVNVTLLGDCKKMVFASLLLKCYWWFKWAVRKVLKIPVGTKGPSWL